MSEATKACNTCRRDLPLSAYHLNPAAADGRQWKCRDCTSEYDKQRRAEKGDELRAYDKARYIGERRNANIAAAKRHYEANREEQIVRKAAWNKANPAARRRIHLKAKYGITPEEFDRMADAQQGLCGICGEDKQLVVDHCHDTGRVRGLLCRQCNAAIGQLRDDPALLRHALEWLDPI
jgi:hypothetical protein